MCSINLVENHWSVLSSPENVFSDDVQRHLDAFISQSQTVLEVLGIHYILQMRYLNSEIKYIQSINTIQKT